MSNEVFLYSEETESGVTNEVGAAALNQIAVDLGGVEFADGDNAFVEGTEYTIDALNRITSTLVTKGILLTGGRCKPTFSDGIISIADGICVFSNGAKKRQNSIETISYIEGGTNYVYFLNDTSNKNKISLVNSLTEPVNGDYIMLAEVSENGNLMDKRTYSAGKYAEGIEGGKRYVVDKYSGTYIFPNLIEVENPENPFTIQATFTLPFIPTYVIMHRPMYYKDNLSGDYAVKVHEGIFFEKLISSYQEYIRLELNGYDVTISTFRNTNVQSSTYAYVQLIFV